MNILLLILLSSLWSIIIVDFFTPFQQFRESIGMGPVRKLVSDYSFLDYFFYLIHKVMNCSLCLSAHVFWISYFFLFGSWFGLLLCPIPYFLTFILKNYLFTIKL